jgi:hypothetical protein
LFPWHLINSKKIKHNPKTQPQKVVFFKKNSISRQNAGFFTLKNGKKPSKKWQKTLKKWQKTLKNGKNPQKNGKKPQKNPVFNPKTAKNAKKPGLQANPPDFQKLKTAKKSVFAAENAEKVRFQEKKGLEVGFCRGKRWKCRIFAKKRGGK